MEMSLTRVLTDVQVEQDGTLLLPARLLGDVARTLPEGTVTLAHRTAERDVELTAGSARFHLKTLTAEDFPKLPAVEGDSATLPAATLAEMIDLVARAASRDEVRPILTGVLFLAQGKTLTMVATDSYRLSVKHSELEDEVPLEVEANVPAKALRELARIIAQEGSEQVEISLSRNQAVFRAGPVTLASRLIEGQFPSWRQLVPDTFEHEVKLPREEFGDVIRRAAVMAQRSTPLRLRFAEGELTVSAATQDIGELFDPVVGQLREGHAQPDRWCAVERDLGSGELHGDDLWLVVATVEAVRPWERTIVLRP